MNESKLCTILFVFVSPVRYRILVNWSLIIIIAGTELLLEKYILHILQTGLYSYFEMKSIYQF